MTHKFAAQLSYQKIKGLGASGAEKGSLLVIGMSSDEDGAVPVKGVKAFKELSATFSLLRESPQFRAKPGSVFTLVHHTQSLAALPEYAHLCAVGLGLPKDFHAQNILGWGARVASEIRSQKLKSADVFLDSFYNAASSTSSDDAPKDNAGRPLLAPIVSREEFLEKFSMGVLLGLYTFDRYKSSAKKDEKKKAAPFHVRLLSSAIDPKKANDILKAVHAIAASVYLTRDLQTTPGGDMPPAEIARQAQQAGRAAGFSVSVWDEKRLKTEGMNGILTVGVGSDNPPRFIIMEYNASKKNLPKIVLVGKGVSFDSGGISIKPAAGMEEMKMDMSGSAAVIGALHALATLKAPIRVVGLIASAENMPSGSAVKPGDIYTAHDGQTVEVINTDAEGRLVLGDALSYAKGLDPDCVIDIATLTGAVIMALGFVSTGLMGNNAKLLDGFKKASAQAGERVWELPLYPEYGEDMLSKVADYRNTGTDRGAGSQKGGSFLNFFVKDSYPWIHLDVAGTADTPKGQGPHCPPDVGTGVPVRSLVEFALNFAEYFGAKKK